VVTDLEYLEQLQQQAGQGVNDVTVVLEANVPEYPKSTQTALNGVHNDGLLHNGLT
jgi:uncharacterized protein involved in exopolysaccharide biosynthesis